MALVREEIVIDGVGLEALTAPGEQPWLFLHGGLGLEGSEAFLELAAARARVIAPSHPGFGHSALPADFRSISDLAYFYLDLAERLDLRDAVLVGSCFGGWLAAEMAIRSSKRFGHLVLVGPLGVKFGDHLSRDIADIHSLPQAEVDALLFHDPGLAERDLTTLSDDDLTAIARSREAFVRFGWKPYMHNPSLRRWLHRIEIPTLVIWGAEDGFVAPDYGRAYAEAIPGARFELVDQAAHYPHIERPEAVAGHVIDFTRNSK